MRGGARRHFASLAGAIALLAATGDARALDPQKTLAQYVAHQWKQSEDGLPQNQVASLVQTRDGYLWMATQEGLVRFDGVRFVTLSTRDVPQVGTNDLDALVEGPDGALWIGTRGAGVARYFDGAFTSFGTKEGLQHPVVLTLHFARDGALWVGTRGGGVSRLKDGRFSTYRVADGLAGDTVWSIAELPDGALSFGTDAGVSLLRDGKLTRAPGSPASNIRALLADADGALWAGSTAGLTRIQNGVATTLAESDGLGGTVFGLLRDHDGNLWAGTQSGVRRLSNAPGAPGTPTAFGALSALDRSEAHPFVGYSFLEDRESNLWIGTQAEGVLRLQDGKVTTFGSGFVWATYEAADGALWLGTEDGLSVLRGDDLVPVAPEIPMVIYAVTEATDVADDGALTPRGMWLSTQAQGVYRFADGKLAQYAGDPALTGVTINVAYEAADGAMWIGTHRGLERVAQGRVRHFTAADGVPEQEVDVIAPAPDGTLWIGGRGGVLRWKNDSFTRLGPDDGIPNAPVETILIDHGDVWIATSGAGLTLMRDGKVGHVRAKDGLFDDVVYALVDDARGSLWMTCNRGIFHAKKADLAAVAMGSARSVTSLGLTTSDGMKSSECNDGRPSGVRAKDGTLWFPTTAGTVRVDPAHMRSNTVVPPVRVEELRVNRTPVSLSGASRTLDADSRDFQFGYTALSFTAPERVRFEYRLEGFDKDWVEAGGRRVAYYTNLSPGTYRFRVKAANDDGVWNDEGSEVSFVLSPHVYQTIPFYLLCGFGLMFLGSVSVRARLLALRARAETLERRIEERTRELATANDDLAGAFKSLADKDARLHEDLLEAQAFQQRILPKLPSGGVVRFRALYRPADLVGGDIYDICALGERHYRVFLADTTGHGVQASLRTMVLKTEYDRVKMAPEGPAHVLAELNRNVATTYPDLELRCSACCLDVIADGDGGARLVYANAAHPPLLRVARGKVEEIYSRGTFVGVMSDATFQQTETRLAPGERLLAYTDGIYEQEDAEGHPFGVDRMITLLTEYALDAEGIVQLLDTEVTTFLAGRPLADDMLLVCIECAGDRRSKTDLS